MRKDLKIFSIILGIIIGLYLILFFIDLSYPFVIVQSIFGFIIFLTFPGCFFGLILFRKYTKFDLIGIIILLNYAYYSLFGIIVIQFGHILNRIHIFWAIIIGVIFVFGTYFVKKVKNQKEKIPNNNIDSMNETSPFQKKFTYLMVFVIFISIITTFIIYLFNYPFIYGDLWEHVSMINSLFNGTVPPESLTFIPGKAVYHSWMSYNFVALGTLIINLPTYQIVFLLSFLEVVIPILLFNFVLNCLLNRESENFYKIKIFALLFFAFFSGFGGIFATIIFFLIPGVYISQGTNFLKAIGIFTGDIFVPFRITGYFVQVFAIGIFFLGIGVFFKIFRKNRFKLSDILLISILSILLMQTHFDICLIFLFLLFILFFPLIFYNKALKNSIKKILIFTILLASLTLLFNLLFANTVNEHLSLILSPIITYISTIFNGIFIITPYLIEILIIASGILSIFIILVIKGFRNLFSNFNRIKNYIVKHRIKIISIMILVYGILLGIWIYSVSDFEINWSTGQLPLYLLPTTMGFLLLFSILGIGIKKPIHNLVLIFLNCWAILLFIVGFFLESFTFSYSSLQTRLISFIAPVLDVLAACYLVYLLKNEKIWNKFKLKRQFWRNLFILTLVCLGSLSYILSIVVQCQRGLDSSSKLTNSEIQSLDWIRENTSEDSCIFGLTEIIDYGIMVIGQRYTTYSEGYYIFDTLITTNISSYFWTYFNESNVSHIIISWERDSSLIDILNESYFHILISTTNTSIIYFQNEITIYDVNLIKLEFI